MTETPLACPVCTAVTVPIARRALSAILRCLDCGLELTHPLPGPDELQCFYDGYRDIRAAREVVRRNAVRQLALLRETLDLTPRSSILDYGCGSNSFVEICRSAGLEDSFGFDPYAGDSTATGRIGDPGIRRWDLITLWGVLEHLRDPLGTLRELALWQPPEAWLVLTTIDREASIPYQYKPPEHLYYFTRDALRRMATLAGYRLVRFEPYRMEQLADVYLDILLRTVPPGYRAHIHHDLPRLVEVPTNEALVLLRRE